MNKYMSKSLRNYFRKLRKKVRVFMMAKEYSKKPFGHKLYNFKRFTSSILEKHIARMKLLNALKEDMRKKGYNV
jgi:hypothetical protein